MFISKIKAGLQTPSQELKKIYRDIFIFSLIGFFILVFTQSFLASITSYLVLFFLYKCFFYSKKIEPPQYYEKNYRIFKRNLIYSLSIIFISTFFILIISAFIHLKFFKILIVIFSTFLVYFILYQLPIILAYLIYFKIKSTFFEFKWEAPTSNTQDKSSISERQLKFKQRTIKPKPNTPMIINTTSDKIIPPFILNTENNSTELLFNLKIHYQSYLGVRHKRQINEIYKIFKEVDLKLSNKNKFYKTRQSISKIQLTLLEQIIEYTQQFLTYPRNEQTRFCRNLNNVPDLWFTQMLNKILDDLLKQVESIYNHDLQSLLDHQEFLHQSLKAEEDFKIDKNL